VDETGHSGDAGAADGGTGAESRDRTLLNGWAARESPWSNAGSALDAETDVPAWRRPGAEVRPFTQERPRQADTPSGEIRPFTNPPPPPSFSPAPGPEGQQPRLENAAAPRWSDSRARYQDLLSHLSPGSEPRSPGSEPRSSGSEPRQNEPPRAGPARPDPLAPELLRPDAQDTTELRAVNGNLPSSAPPYPYEGDLDDARQEPPRPQAGQQRAAVPAERPFPAVRPATPGGRRADWITPESARHALNPPTPMEGLPRISQAPVTDESRSGDQGMVRPSYDPSSFPRRLPYEPADTPAGYAPAPAVPGRSAGDPGPPGQGEQQSFPALPQRVPAQPDVPTVPEPPSVEPPAETPALARIATHLRRGDVLSAQERQEGFDVNAILAAVREVDGVRDASLRSTPAGAHSLRLDLSEGADPAEVSRQVARLLQDRMGLDAAMKGASPLAGAPSAPAPRSAPPAPSPLSPAPAPRSAPPAYSAPAPVSPPPARVTPPPAPVSPPPVAQASAPPAPLAPFVPSQPNPAGRPAPTGTSYSSGSRPVPSEAPTSVEPAPPRPLDIGERPGPRVMIENVRVNTFGTEATVEVRLTVNGRVAAGEATGPAVDGYLLRLCAMATAGAVDELLTTSDHADGPAKCFVEHAGAVPFGSMQVAVVVLLLSVGGWVEQLSGSAVITGDDRHAMVRATLAAVNRRLEALLS
jgi:hypothetical protein